LNIPCPNCQQIIRIIIIIITVERIILVDYSHFSVSPNFLPNDLNYKKMKNEKNVKMKNPNFL
jgi:hypothetical protein